MKLTNLIPPAQRGQQRASDQR